MKRGYNKNWKCQGKKKMGLWSLKPFAIYMLWSACIGTSVAGASEKPGLYFFYLLHHASSAHPVCYVCINLLPGTPALSVSKQPPLLLVLNEMPFPPQRPSLPFLPHSQPCLACSTRVSSLSCTWFLFGRQLLLSAIALGLHTSK